MDSGVLFALVQQSAEAAGKVSGGINFDVSIGDLISVGTTIVGIVSMYTRLAERITRIETKVDAMWEPFVERRTRPR